MPKRKSSNPCASIVGGGGNGVVIQQPSVACFDAALDLLACDTFSRLDQIKRCFEDRAGIQFEDGIVQRRWDEAVKRYWVMKSMDELCCSMRSAKGNGNGEMDQDDIKSCVDEKQRQRQQAAANQFIYPGVISAHSLCPDEAAEWRRWVPKVGDLVLVQLDPEQVTACSPVSIPGGAIWPAKIIDKRMFFQGRTVPRGNHFFPVRVYHESMPPTITIKSRLLPFHLRPDPPILANEAIQSAYHHAKHPESFDLAALARETQAAYQRTHPGVVGAALTSTEEGDEIAQQVARRKKEKEEWNRLVNWVMNERRIEKLRTIEEERGKRLKDIAKSQTDDDELGIGGRGDEMMGGGAGDSLAKKRRVVPLPDSTPSVEKVSGHEDRGGIFKVSWGRSSTPTRNSNSPAPPPTVAPTPHSIFGPNCTITTPLPSLASFIRPALSTPQRPLSPRRLAEKKRSGTYTSVGEYSPRGRGHTYTPPRILPSGDETAPSSLQRSTGSPAPSRNNFDFDFVSPLGRAPVRVGSQDDVEIAEQDRSVSSSVAGEGKGSTPILHRRTGSLEAVKEEEGENDLLSSGSGSGPGSGPGSGSAWTVVGGGKRGKRAGSAPCSKCRDDSVSEVAADGMDMKE